MPEGGFYQPRRTNPTALAAVIMLHAAALSALALSKSEVVRESFTRTVVRLIPVEPDPPPVPAAPRKPSETHRSVVTSVPPLLPLKPLSPVRQLPTEDVVPFDPQPVGDLIKPPPELPKPAPLRTEARLDPGSELLPPYPPSEQRAEREGSVTVRLTVGPDGRVRLVEKISAASKPFFRATERQALRHWRFKPATLDGRPVESRTTLTVHFRLES